MLGYFIHSTVQSAFGLGQLLAELSYCRTGESGKETIQATTSLAICREPSTEDTYAIAPITEQQ